MKNYRLTFSPLHQLGSNMGESTTGLFNTDIAR
jgi:hypothetical protein